MKRLLTLAAVALTMVLTASIKNTASAQPGVGVDITYQDFYDELSPYGDWIEYPEYGYVWRPSGIQDFQPYSTNGRWVWSDEYEWMWVSDYNWGWAPFHYGRWFSDPNYGWMWMPGYEWGPAWVAWRDGGDYYGWAPLRPGFNIGVNISIGSYNPPIDYWCFAPRRYISSHRIYDYCLPRRQNVTIINNTTIINNYGRRGNSYFAQGPRRADAERYAGRIRPVRFRDASAPGRSRVRNNEVSVYRPNIRRDNNNNTSIAPRKFERYDRSDATRNNGTARRNDNTNSRFNNNDRTQRNADADRPRTNFNNGATERRTNGFGRNNDNTTRPNSNAGDRTDRRVREQGTGSQNEARTPERRPGFERNNNRDNSTRPNNEARNNPTERRNTDFRTRSENNNRRVEQPSAPERRNQSVERRTPSNPAPQQRFERRAESRPAPQMREQRQAPARQFESRGGETRNREVRNSGGGDRGNRGGSPGRRQ